MSREIFDKIKASLVRERLGAIIICSNDNVTYTAGYEVPSQVFPIRERLIFCIITAGVGEVMLVPDMEYTLAKSSSRFAKVCMYNEFTQNPVQELKVLLDELGVAREHIAIEDDFIPWVYLDEIYKIMPDANFSSAKYLMAEHRKIKTTRELDLLRKANKIAEKAHYHAALKGRSGMTELAYAQLLSEYLYANGIESINKLVVGSGERSEHPNANPTSKRLQPGELVRADIFAKIQGYLSDVARTGVVGTPTAHQMESWSTVVEARNLILDQIRPGASTLAIYTAFSQHFERAGLKPTNFVGHGLGITLHEDPYISRYHNQELQQGMVLAIEPMCFTNGEGYQLEEVVVVNSTGYELLTDCGNPNNLISIPI
jgi:Xaa-Pro dipeptidase